MRKYIPKEIEVKIKHLKPLRLTVEESRCLGELWYWQRKSVNSSYIFTDKPR